MQATAKPEERNILQERLVLAVHGLHRAEIIEVLGIDVGDDADLRRQPRERAVALIRFDDHPLALPEPRVRAPGVDDAAGDHGRLLARFREDVGEQRCRRRLAVRAGDRDGRIEPHQLGEHFRAPDDRQALLACRDEFGVQRLDRRRNHDIAGADEVDRVMAHENTDALGAQPLDVGAFFLVGALDGVALGDQDLGDRAHADAADADDVKRPYVARHLHG